MIFSFWKERYSLPLTLNLFPLPPGKCAVQEDRIIILSFFLFPLPLFPTKVSLSSLQSFKKKKLIPYLWGSGTIYRSCNVIRGQVWEQGTCRCSARLTRTHFITWHCSFSYYTHTSKASKVTTVQLQETGKYLILPAYQNCSKISRSPVNPCSSCVPALHSDWYTYGSLDLPQGARI